MNMSVTVAVKEIVDQENQSINMARLFELSESERRKQSNREAQPSWLSAYAHKLNIKPVLRGRSVASPPIPRLSKMPPALQALFSPVPQVTRASRLPRSH